MSASGNGACSLCTAACIRGVKACPVTVEVSMSGGIQA